MRACKLLVLAIAVCQSTFAEAPPPVDWAKGEQVEVPERLGLVTQLVVALRAAGCSMLSDMTVKAEFMSERECEPFKEVFFTLHSPSGDLWVRCLYPKREWLKSFRDWAASDAAEKYGEEVFARRLKEALKEKSSTPYPEVLDTVARHTRKEAEARARLLASTVGGVDLTTWRCVSWVFNRGQWQLSFHPFFGSYRLNVASVTVCLSDAEDLKLCEYSNTMLAPLPLYDRIPDVIGQAKARELADQYLKQYYRRRDQPSLTFRTNTLEVVRPNYYFTDKYDEKGKWLTNRPRWSWTAQYERSFSTNYFTFTKTPVWIYVDAETGEMLGGTE